MISVEAFKPVTGKFSMTRPAGAGTGVHANTVGLKGRFRMRNRDVFDVFKFMGVNGHGKVMVLPFR